MQCVCRTWGVGAFISWSQRSSHLWAADLGAEGHRPAESSGLASPAARTFPSLPCLPEPFCQRKQPPSFTQARAVLLGAGVQCCGGPGHWGGCPPAHRAGDGRCWASLGEFIVSCCWCFRDHSAYPPNSQMRANSLYRPLKPKILLIPSSNE